MASSITSPRAPVAPLTVTTAEPPCSILSDESITEWRTKWESSTIAIEEVMKSINKELDGERRDSIDLRIPINILKDHVATITDIYKKVETLRAAYKPEKSCGYPKGKFRSFTVVLLGVCSGIVGGVSNTINSQSADCSTKDDTLSWVSTGFAAAAVVCLIAGSALSNDWGNKETQIGQLNTLAARSNIITNTSATIRIFERYTLTPIHQRKTHYLKINLNRILSPAPFPTSRASPKAIMLESPLLKLSNRPKNVTPGNVTPGLQRTSSTESKRGDSPPPDARNSIGESDEKKEKAEERKSTLTDKKSVTADKGEMPDAKENLELAIDISPENSPTGLASIIVERSSPERRDSDSPNK